MKQPVLALLCGVVVAAWPAGTHAAPIQFTQTFVADYEFNILGGTSLNPGPATGFIPFRAIGDLTFQLDPGINNPALTTVPFVNMTGSLPGVPPSPPFTLPHAISPNLEFIGGQLTNIVRDSNGNVTSADVVNLESRWTLTTPGFTLYTKVGLPLTSSPLYGARAIDLCNAGDPVCSGGDSVPAHRDYGPSGLTNQAAAFVAGLL